MEVGIRIVKFFVEGKSDKVFLRALLKLLYKIELNEEQWNEVIIVCGGHDGIPKQKHEFLEVNPGGKREGGNNIVLFDADYTATEKNHGFANKSMFLETIKNDFGLTFEYYLFPNNKDDGTLETLLKTCINPESEDIMSCWGNFEQCLEHSGKGFTLPAEKSRIYVYLECLHGTTKADKNKIKDLNRDFTDQRLWSFDFANNNDLIRLKTFLDKHLIEKD